MPEPICDGLTVVECSAGSMSASLVGMLLADNGAHVLKIEPPAGDRLRDASPAGFLVWNRGKDSKVLDLRSTQGQHELRTILEDTDVFVEAFEAGVAEQWGLAYEDLRSSHPSLVYCSIKGFATKGPYAHIKGYEGLVAGKSGVYYREKAPYRRGPIFVNLPLASFGASHMALAGIMSALRVRDQSGQGQLVEASLWQGLNPFDNIGTFEWQLAQRQSLRGSQPVAASHKDGDDTALPAASRTTLTTCTSDGRWLYFQTILPHQAQALLRACGLAHLLDEPQFKDAPFFSDIDDAVDYESRVLEEIRRHPAAELVERLLAEPDVPFELVVSAEEAMRHPQVVHNGHIIELDAPDRGRVRQVGPIARFEATPSRIVGSAPAVGEQREPRLGTRSKIPTLVAQDPLPGGLPRHPLAGITIVELGSFYAPNFGNTMLAALGARVIKLEPPGGDPMRYSFGSVREAAAVKVLEGKESLCLDLRLPAAQEIAHKLVARADVFTVGFRSGVAEKFNLSYERLRAINPRLIYLHATGYGVDGPYAHRPMFAATVFAAAGGFYRNAGYWFSPEIVEGMTAEEAQIIVAPHFGHGNDGDSNGSLCVLSALSLALYHQHRTGQGQFLATSMLNGTLYLLSDEATEYEGKPAVLPADPEHWGLHALYRLYPAAEGWVFLAAPTQREWTALAGALQRQDLLDDPRFARPDDRQHNDSQLVKILEEVFSAKASETWEKELASTGVGCVAVYEGSASQFTSTDQGLRESGLTFEVQHPHFGPIVRHGIPVTLSSTPGRVAPGCLPGQHTDALLAELGYSEQEIACLKQSRTTFG